jgi:hypothetical protein
MAIDGLVGCTRSVGGIFFEPPIVGDGRIDQRRERLRALERRVDHELKPRRVSEPELAGHLAA